MASRSELDSNRRFHIGKVIGFHGLKGEVKIRPRTDADLVLDVETVTIKTTDAQEVAATVKDARIDKRNLLMSFDEFADRTAIEFAAGADIYTTYEQLRELDENEWWITDLIGMRVVTANGAAVGTVKDVVGEISQLLEIERSPERTTKSDSQDETILVPFVKALVPEVDMKAGRIVVVDLPGLLD